MGSLIPRQSLCSASRLSLEFNFLSEHHTHERFLYQSRADAMVGSTQYIYTFNYLSFYVSSQHLILFYYIGIFELSIQFVLYLCCPTPNESILQHLRAFLSNQDICFHHQRPHFGIHFVSVIQFYMVVILPCVCVCVCEMPWC